jgi:hypothetical protein
LDVGIGRVEQTDKDWNGTSMYKLMSVLVWKEGVGKSAIPDVGLNEKMICT